MVIYVKDLKYTYPGAHEPALQGLDFAIEEGEIFGFLGPNGAGKTTTQKVLINIFKDYKGNVSIKGKDLPDWGPALYERIGVCFELPALYTKLTGMENLRFFSSFYEEGTEDLDDLLAMVGLADAADRRVGEYSKGMKMKLEFARAFINKPEILFLDEPTTGLDPISARSIKDIILEKKKEGRTIFLTTHNMNVADELCDRVALIADGQLKLIGNPRELKLAKASHVVRVEYLEGKEEKEAEFPLKGLGTNKDFLTLLSDKTVQRIYTVEPTLEEIFIDTTGRKLT